MTGISSAFNSVFNIIFVFVYMEKHINICPILLSRRKGVISLSTNMFFTTESQNRIFTIVYLYKKSTCAQYYEWVCCWKKLLSDSKYDTY